MVNAFNQLYITNKTERFSFKSGHALQVAKLIKEDWPMVLRTVRTLCYFLKHLITKVPEYKAEELNFYALYVFLSDESLVT